MCTCASLDSHNRSIAIVSDVGLTGVRIATVR